MNGENFIRDLRKYANNMKLYFGVYKRNGKGSHYVAEAGDAFTVMQSDPDILEMKRCLKQLKIDPADL
jgi:hypothetical protein